jgi:hypothetical protein
MGQGQSAPGGGGGQEGKDKVRDERLTLCLLLITLPLPVPGIKPFTVLLPGTTAWRAQPFCCHWLHGLPLRPQPALSCFARLPGGVTLASPLPQAQEKKKKYEPPAPPPRVGKKQRRRDAASSLGTKLPTITPTAKCKLRLLKLERVKDWLLMEEEFVQNQERQKPADERNEEERTKVDDLRGTPLSVGTLEEMIDENHAIVSSAVGPEYYVTIMSFVDKMQLEPGSTVLLHNKVRWGGRAWCCFGGGGCAAGSWCRVFFSSWPAPLASFSTLSPPFSPFPNTLAGQPGGGHPDRRGGPSCERDEGGAGAHGVVRRRGRPGAADPRGGDGGFAAAGRGEGAKRLSGDSQRGRQGASQRWKCRHRGVAQWGTGHEARGVPWCRSKRRWSCR